MESHGDKIHTCPDCGREFKVWHAFRIHCKTHQKGATTKKRTFPKKKSRKQWDNDEDSESGSNISSYNSNSEESPGNTVNNISSSSQCMTPQEEPRMSPQLHPIQPTSVSGDFSFVDSVMPH